MSPRLGPQCSVHCTSGVMDDVTLTHNHSGQEQATQISFIGPTGTQSDSSQGSSSVTSIGLDIRWTLGLMICAFLEDAANLETISLY